MRTSAKRSRQSEALVVGAGPAGLALAAALAEAGVDTALVGDADPRGWVPRYAIWVDEADRAGVYDTLATQWSFVKVRTGEHKVHRLERPYASFDNEKLAGHLLSRLDEAGSGWTAGRVEELTATADGLRATLTSGEEIATRVVFDATGKGALLNLRRPRRAAAQVAYGQLLEDAELPWPEDGGAMLMDLTGPERERRPTFLYALPLGPGKIFVEETSLASSPPMTEPQVRERLARRLEQLGVKGRVTEEERCFIPLGLPIPDRNQRVVGFGAAASMTHPATGYQVASALERAPHVARAVRRGLADQRDPADLARLAWDQVWPEARVKTRELQRFGMEVVARLHGADQRTFFDAFFTAAEDEWDVLMSAEASATDLGRVMDRTFAALPIRLRSLASRRLMLGHPKLVPHLARAIWTQRFNPRRALVGGRAG